MAKPSKPDKLTEPDSQPLVTPPEEEAETSELALEILPHTAAGIAVLADDLSVSSWNPQAERITGHSLEAVASRGLARLFEPAEVMQHILRKVQDGIPTLSEYLYLRHATGHLLSVTVQCSPQRYLNRNDCQVVVAFRELQPLQERLRRDEHLQMLGRLASALSHEIRNPLNAIFLHADILEEELSNPPEQIVESLGEIKTEIGRLDDLVQDYLSLARLSELSRDPADMGGLVKAMGLELHEQLESRGIALHLKDLDHLGEVSLNRNAFRRAVLNLVHNAMDAMPHADPVRQANANPYSSRSQRHRQWHCQRATPLTLYAVSHHQARWYRDGPVCRPTDRRGASWGNFGYQ
jgi:PAS domain S-box-containing protein